MLTKNQIKFISSLKQKKFREELHLFIAEGRKTVSELLRSEIKVKQIVATSAFLKEVRIPGTVEYIEVKAADMERISALATPTDVLAVCEIPNYNVNFDDFRTRLTLVLDSIKDPGNLGTIMRIADWFGISDIVCSEDTADAFNPKVVQATMGSVSRVKVHYLPLVHFFNKLKSDGYRLPVWGAFLEGENIYNKKLATAGFIVIGNESRGISNELIPYITDKISIPAFSHSKSGKDVESLNAAVATAIICSEFRRR